MTMGYRNECVKMRTGMVMVLQEAIKQGNEGNFDMFKSTLQKIHSTHNYSVKFILDRDVVIDGIHYYKGERVTQIFEGSRCIIAIYKDRRDDMTVLYIEPDDLLTEEEIEAKYAHKWAFEDMMEKMFFGKGSQGTQVFIGKNVDLQA
jgi:hypothetical protein